MGNCCRLREPIEIIIVVGLENSGRKTLIQRVCMQDENFSDYFKSDDLEVQRTAFKQFHILTFQCKEENYEHYKKLQAEFNCTIGMVFVVDATDTEGLHKAAQSFNKLRTIEQLHNVPTAICLNKIDLSET